MPYLDFVSFFGPSGAGVMQVPKLNEWLNFLASIGVLAGLLLVAYEIRQTNSVVFAEARGNLLSDYQALSMSAYGPEMGGMFLKSIEEPDQLTDEEIFKLSEWLNATMSIYNKQAVLYYQFGWAADPTDDIEIAVEYYFGGLFARYWYLENKYWMDPNLVEIIDREIAANTVSEVWQFSGRIRSQLSNPESGQASQRP